MESPDSDIHETPAADAASLFVRIGFGLLVLVAPFAALFLRQSFVVLAPIGMLLIIISAFIKDTEDYLHRIRLTLATPLGMLVLGVTFWAVLSLVWAPFPGLAAERIFRSFGNIALATAACLALPERMRLSNLNLISVGLGIAMVALIIGVISGSNSLQFITLPRGPTLARAAIAASVLVWAALAWTMTRKRDIEGILLVGACSIAALASGSEDAIAVLVVALLVFMAGRARQRLVARILAWFWSGLILLSPLLALIAQFISRMFKLDSSYTLTDIGAWGPVILQQPARLLTGHGFDTYQRARQANIFDPEALGGLLPEVWFDLGLPGALALAVIVFIGFRAMAQAQPHVSAAALAVSSAILVFMVSDTTSTQHWWLSVCVVAAVTMTAVLHGQYRTRRPRPIGKRPTLGG